MLKKLKSLFIVEDESNASAKKKENPQNPNPKTENTSGPVSTTKTSIRTDSKVDQKFVDVLLKAIDKQNMEGFDYLEFKQSLQSLSKMDMDEGTRFKSAFAMAKTMGASQTNLVESAEKYISILVGEERKFEDALKNQRSRQIAERESTIKQIKQSISDKQQQIKALEKDISIHQKKLEQEGKKLNQASAKLEGTKQRFEVAYQLVVGQIKDDLDKIKQYL